MFLSSRTLKVAIAYEDAMIGFAKVDPILLQADIKKLLEQIDWITAIENNVNELASRLKTHEITGKNLHHLEQSYEQLREYVLVKVVHTKF